MNGLELTVSANQGPRRETADRPQHLQSSEEVLLQESQECSSSHERCCGRARAIGTYSRSQHIKRIKPSFHSNNIPTSASEPPKPDEPDLIPHGPGIHRPSFPHASKIAITNHSNLHLVLPATASHATSSGTLSNLHASVIDLSPASTASPFAAIYLKNITSSLILCGQVAGAIHITNVTDSVLVITTRQFRMHGSRNVDVYLHAASRPIVEDCVDVRFAPLPGGFMGEGMDADGRENMWDRIDDFKWLKVEPSPNFRVLGVEERLGEEVWDKVKSAGEGEGEGAREEILRAVGVQL
jgi:hypothetical protein